MSAQEPRTGRPLRADPELYDSPRAERARAKGLQGPYITGGDDPRARGRAPRSAGSALLVAMVVMIVAAGFVIGIAALLVSRSRSDRGYVRPSGGRGREQRLVSAPTPTSWIIARAHPDPVGQPAGPRPRPTARAARRATSPTGSPTLGLEPEFVEPVPGRGSVHVRLRGDGTGGEPLLLLSHLDVVPAPPERWTHDPFAADVADGYV